MARRSPQTSSLVAGLCGLSLLAIAVSLVQPVASQGAAPSAAMQLLRTALTATLAMTLLIGPGIAIRAWRPGRLAPMTYLTLPGLALLVLPTAVTQGRLLGTEHAATDAVAVAVMLVGVGALACVLWRAMRVWSEEPPSTPPMFEGT